MGKIRLWIVKRLLRDEFSKLEEEVDDEFRFHLEMKEASMVAGGMDPDEARDEARRHFGDAERLRQVGVQRLSEGRRRERTSRLSDSFLHWAIAQHAASAIPPQVPPEPEKSSAQST